MSDTSLPGMTAVRPGARIAYLGPRGTFSEEALLATSELCEAELVPMATIEDAVDAAEQRQVEAAFVPIENSIEGSVNAALDRLIFDADLLIRREAVLDVHLDLLAVPGTALGDVTTVLSFPVATAECRRFLAAKLPGAGVVPAGSTADAARLVAERAERGLAAVAPGITAELYDLDVLAHGIEDHTGNQTRFVLVGPDQVPARTGHDKTSIVCFQHADHPGSLHQILGQFAARSLNLTRIESRPTKQALGDYCFVIDVEGHISDEVLADCLEELHVELEAVKLLGSYPAVGARSAAIRAEIAARRIEARSWLDGYRRRIAGQ